MTDQQMKTSAFREPSGKVSSTRVVILLSVCTVLFLLVYATVAQVTIPELPASIVTFLGTVFLLKGADKALERRG